MGSNLAYSDIPEGFAVEASPVYADIPEGFQIESGGETVRAKTPAIRPPMYKDDGLTQMTAGEVGDLQNRPAPQPRSYGQIAWDTVTDPLGQLGVGVETLATAAGMNPSWAARLGRDARDLLPSMGPLGYEFSPLPAVPAREAAPAATAMPKASVRTEAELQATGGARMGTAKQSTATVSPEDMQSVLTDLNAKFRKASLRVHPKLHSKAAPVMADIVAASKQPQTLEELHYLRQLTEDAAKAGGTEGKVGMMMKSAVDDMIAKHPEGASFAQGTSEYARAKKSQIVSEAIEKARNSVLWDRGKESAALRHQIKALLNNKQYKNTWSAQERAALQSAKARTLMEVFGGMGSKNISGAAFGRMLEVGVGLPPGTLWVPGHFARQSANARSLQKLEDVATSVRAGGEVQAARVDRLKDLVSEKVLQNIMEKTQGARHVAAWITAPSAQTARVLAAYVSRELKVPDMAQRIFAEIQGTETGQAEDQQ